MQGWLNAKELIEKLDYWKKELEGKYTQEILRKFVTNKNNPLDERFRVWSNYCSKEEKGFLIHKGEFGVIGEMVDECWPYEYDRYRTYDYEDFLFHVEDHNNYPDDNPIEIKIPTVNEFKELLIQTNFGSFVYDW